MDYRTEAPQIIRDFITYHETIRGHSKLTVNEYYLDLRTFFRYLKQSRGLVPDGTDMSAIGIADIDLAFVASVTLNDVYDFMGYLSRERERHQNAPENGVGLMASTRSRKIATIRTFYKYLTLKAGLMKENPMQSLDSPKLRKTLPRYLTLGESMALLDAASGKNRERDYCILTIFLNCGLRISELVGLNVRDIRDDSIRVLGKGNKERTVFLNDACIGALRDWLQVRTSIPGLEVHAKGALFVSPARRTRLTTDAVHKMVKTTLLKAGLDASRYSSHKLRHTAATLMHQNGVDVRTLQEILGHEHLNTTEIYTHIDSTDKRVAARANPLSSVKRKK